MADSTLLASFRVISQPLAQRLRDTSWISPNGVTLAGFALSIAGICLPVLYPGAHPAAIVAAALILIGTVFDTLDGDLARAQRRSSAFGAWLDGFIDRVSEVLFVVVLGWGLPATELWSVGSRELALAALILGYLGEYSGLLWGRHTSGEVSDPAPGPAPAGGLRSLVRRVGSLLGPASIVRQLLLVACLLINRPLLYFPVVCSYELLILGWGLAGILRRRRG